MALDDKFFLLPFLFFFLELNAGALVALPQATGNAQRGSHRFETRRTSRVRTRFRTRAVKLFFLRQVATS